MKTYLMTILTAFAFFAYACGNDTTDDSKTEMEKTAEELQSEMDKKAKEVAETYNEQMAALGNRIDMIKEKANDVPDKLKKDYNNAMDAVAKQKDELAMKMEEMKNSPTSQKIQAQVDSITNEINSTLAMWKDKLSTEKKK